MMDAKVNDNTTEELTDEALATLRELEAKREANPVPPETLPKTLSYKQIIQRPELFQPRSHVITEGHVLELGKQIKNHGTLDEVLVLAIGDEFYLVDGHHRLEAYRRAKVFNDIPISYYEGSLEEAVLQSGLTNSKVKLPMGNQERQDYAWKLVKLQRYSKSQIASASGVSTRQVARMRSVLKQLGKEAMRIKSWYIANRKARGEFVDTEWNEDKIEEMAEKAQQKIWKAFGLKLQENPEVAARALVKYFNHRLPDVLRYLRDDLLEIEEEMQQEIDEALDDGRSPF